ncbi:MAG: RNA polymerase sigma factor [Termitinemataceae bacterium]|nr:MAG: RNA polymerase sigma factor [Termitinemataceae bacterium]
MNKGYVLQNNNILQKPLNENCTPVVCGDRSDFSKIYDEVFPILYRVALRITRSGEAAEDLCQDSFFQLYNKQMQFAKPEEAKYWLIRVVKNASINYSKRKIKEREVYQKAFRQQKTTTDDGESDFIKKEDIEAVQIALHKLPKALSSVLIYKEYADMNYKEIGAALGISEGNVKVRVFRARERLTAIMTKMQGENK